jgi:hypothetical protein
MTSAEKFRVFYHKRIAQGRCVKCGRKAARGACVDCRSDQSAQMAERYQRRRALGQCVVCESPSATFARCFVHRIRSGQYTKAYRARLRAKRAEALSRIGRAA